MSERMSIIAAILTDVSELPDRTSPDDFPESMVVTSDELMIILERHLQGVTLDYQCEVRDWMFRCFGPEISADELERADRFTEEALELAQTMPGFTADRAHALVDYVFGRPVGNRDQEVGGVMVTLAALCNVASIDIAFAAKTELARVWMKIDQIRAKQASKPTGSALPTAETRTP